MMNRKVLFWPLAAMLLTACEKGLVDGVAYVAPTGQAASTSRPYISYIIIIIGLCFNLFQLTSLRVDDKPTNHDVLRYQRMSLNGLNGLTNGGRCVLEALQPLVEVDATLADGIKRFIRHATSNHLVMEVVITHVAGSAMRVGHHHDFLYT